MIDLQTPPQNSLLQVLPLIDVLFEQLEKGNFHAAKDQIDLLATNPRCPFQKSYLDILKEACATQNWRLLSESFIRRSFISDCGHILFISPFSIRRQGKVFNQLTGVFGRVLTLGELNDFSISRELKRFQNFQFNLGEILPFESYCTFGFTGTNEGEAFLVPNGWRLDQSSSGPGLNDLRQQRARFLTLGLKVIKDIFDERSSKMLLSWTNNIEKAYSIQNLEFQYHELGHSTGFGLKEKIKNKIFVTPWYAAIEEWRSDGVGFHLAKKTLSPEDYGNLVAANLCLRFGTDSQRLGGMELDSDVNSSLILFDRLIQNGSITITKDFKISLECSDISELPELLDESINDAIKITKEENKLSDIRGVWNLYGSLNILPISKTLFSLLVRKQNLTTCYKLK